MNAIYYAVTMVLGIDNIEREVVYIECMQVKGKIEETGKLNGVNCERILLHFRGKSNVIQFTMMLHTV